MRTKNFSDYVYETYNSYRIEEFNNGTAALLGFNNFAEIEELENQFKGDESFIEIAEFLKERNEIKARIESLTNEQFIALDCANTIYSEALNKEDICYYDSHSDIYYQIALM